MASPQPENGTTNISNEIIEALMNVNLSPYETRVMWFIFRKTYGWSKKLDWIALSQFEKCIGLDRRLIHRTLQGLQAKNIIIISRDDKMRVMYGFQKDYEKWVFPKSSKGGKREKKLNQIVEEDLSSTEMMDTTIIYIDDEVSSTEMTTKETITKQKTLCAFELEPTPISKPPKKSKKLTEDTEFPVFYEIYPLKMARKKAEEAWNRLGDKRPPLEVIVGAVRQQLKWRSDAKSNGIKFYPRWPMPATWLNQHRWEDENYAKTTKKSKEWTDE